MLIHWLEQTDSDLPLSNQWLSPEERTRLDRMIFLKRRSDWRLGRWTAKKAVATFLELPADEGALAEIEIRAAPSGAPDVYLAKQPAPISISLSHRDGVALCAVAPQPAFGCDLELVETRGPEFVGDYFTAEERSAIESASFDERAELATLLWSAKESTLKALRVGLREDTREVCVQLQDRNETSHGSMQPVCLVRRDINGSRWRPLSASHARTQAFHGWWRLENDLMRTIVCAA